VRMSIPLTGGVLSPRYVGRAFTHHYSHVSAINAAWTAVIKTPGDCSGVTSINYSHNVSFHCAPGPACRGSASLYVPPLNYKREGTQRYRGGSQAHKFTQTLRLNTTYTVEVGYYAPAA
jgi:hypothetical protein